MSREIGDEIIVSSENITTLGTIGPSFEPNFTSSPLKRPRLFEVDDDDNAAAAKAARPKSKVSFTYKLYPDTVTGDRWLHHHNWSSVLLYFYFSI